MFSHQTLFAAGGVATAVSARYWRLLATDISWYDPYGGHAYFQAIYEFEFYTTRDASGNNVALNKTASASAGGAYAANDGSPDSYWQEDGSTVGGPRWWSVDLASHYYIGSIRMKLFTIGYHAKKYMIQYSNDGSIWTNLKEINTVQATATQTFSIQ